MYVLGYSADEGQVLLSALRHEFERLCGEARRYPDSRPSFLAVHQCERLLEMVQADLEGAFTCLRCGKVWDRQKKRGRVPSYCSPACRQAAYRERLG